MTQTCFVAPDIECGGCASSIQKALSKVEGITDIQVEVETKTVQVTHNPDLVSVEAILTRLDHVGFPATVK